MKLALVQINPTIGALAENAAAIARSASDAAAAGADLIVFPELALTGYPPRDLLLQEGFLEDVRATLLALVPQLPARATVALGSPWCSDADAPRSVDPVAWREGVRPTNALLCFRGGRAIARHDKRLLPTYDVFDEHRYFRAGRDAVLVEVAGVRVGLTICEDLWKGLDVGSLDRYADLPDPVEALARAGAQLIINPSASPFSLAKRMRQREVMAMHIARHGIPIASVNQVGGNDDLIFDGHAAVLVPGERGGAPRLVAAGPGFREGMVYLEFDPRGAPGAAVADPITSTPPMRHLFDALVLGVRDYCRKCGFASAVLGLSGGIDSALTACIAAAALGGDRVLGVTMPSVFSSPGSVGDSELLARGLGMRLLEVPIRDAHAVVSGSLEPAFVELGAAPRGGITDENIQSRLRGLYLMAFSNRTGAILLTTGNKSELAVGYCTLYGDMNGGLAVLADVTKQDVYELARFINTNHASLGFRSPPIPEASITKPPSAELRANQKDQDSLPPYEVLDEVVERYIEHCQSPGRIVRETGFAKETVVRIIALIDAAEHKRKQMPIGLKVTGIAFGRGRRRAIAQGYRAGAVPSSSSS